MFRAKNAESRTTLVTGIEYQVHKAWFFLMLVLGLAIINCADVNLFFTGHSGHTSTQTNQNWVQFQNAQLTPYKTTYAFPTHFQARELCPQTYSLSLSLEWSQVTHIPASIKSGGAYKPEKSAFYSTFARQLCDDTCLPGWLSAFPVHSQTFKPTQASFAHTNSQPSITSMSYKMFLGFFFWSVGGFKVPPSHMKVPQATSEGHAPLVDSGCCHGKV